MDMEKKVTNEELARMIAKGFDGVDKRFDGVDKRLGGMDQRFDRIDKRLDHLDARMGRMEADLNEIRSNLVYRHEFEDLMARVKYLEIKMGIESGK